MAWCVCLPVFGANCPSLSVYRVVSVSLTVEGIDCLCGQPTSTKGPVKGQTVIALDISQGGPGSFMCACCNVCVLGRRCGFTLFQVHVRRWLAGSDVPRGECILIFRFLSRNFVSMFYLTIAELIDVITQCPKFSEPGHDSDCSAEYLLHACWALV